LQPGHATHSAAHLSNLLGSAPRRRAGGDVQRAVIVAMGAMAMMQVAIHQIVDVVTVRH
jgi:hypothetical protein